ncbi:MAG: toxin HicA [Candidatus Vogelbacteria bacterium CG10_big_fil_rev_8_21_14_0_10_45_14]|uniref:Toxin HicA n=1 Tax=Candidatus Vogelbacteria bacterium CG10_big_fil_rev_8_21_14_0_10_45_14 TaxID=1975042 RepID=A0A2H0RK22_9BACT|nr:MAG: toxin HicA [Candidatus Vogelbacteria bacterium CG10_big_fil_rev_8_21_14_0_10_45_14]
MRLPNLTPRKLLKALRRAGFVEVEQKGSHLYLTNYSTKRHTGIPMHGKDLKRSLMKAIIRQAGMIEAEFAKYI